MAFGDWLRSRLSGQADTLSWHRVAVFERDGSKRAEAWDWRPGTEVDAHAFEPRFDEILEQSARGWVNLVAEIIDDDRLILAVRGITGS